MPFVTIQDGECRASFATSRRREDSPSRSLRGGDGAGEAGGTPARLWKTLAATAMPAMMSCDDDCEHFGRRIFEKGRCSSIVMRKMSTGRISGNHASNEIFFPIIAQ
ncbi:uncharacterized protein LOC105431146 isoform X2 [Pogonomyrmex barbatus]|nr:uncharacterized protein LOC105431146 isoform X2 [Pogonomyrmex barbatus]